MFAIVDIKGNQYKITEKETLKIAKISEKEGSKVAFDKVLLLAKDPTSPTIGSPYISGASVECKVLNHGKAPKIRVFKMKPKKRYSRTFGHRQAYTEVEVVKINEKK